MAKGYWIARVDVSNEDGYKPYVAANAAIFRRHGGRFLVRGGKFECPEGSSRTRNIVIEFPDYATALACYRSPEYQHNITVRQRMRSPTLSSSKVMTGHSRRIDEGSEERVIRLHQPASLRFGCRCFC
jgi:uncharacterized protein (DUF1330 family)